jgi:hypothetical protein
MSTSSRLTLPYILPQQAQKHVTVNEAVRRLDALVQLSVVSRTVTVQPGSPADGDCYILPAGKTGAAWGAMTNLAVAYYVDGAWTQLTPREGWTAYVQDTDVFAAWNGSSWNVIASAARRETLTANRTYFVRTDGSDSNSGLADNAGGAFLTVQKAVDTAAALDLSTFDVTIQLRNGTYTGAVTLKTLVGAGLVTILGDTATPANVVISTTSASCFTASGIVGRWRIAGVKLQTTTSGSGLSALGATTTVAIGSVDFGAIAENGVFVQNGAFVTIDASYTISGDSNRHWNLLAGTLQVETVTVTLSGTRAFGTEFCLCTRLSYVRANAVTFSGAGTGTRYTVSANGVVFVGGAGANFFPGNIAGSAASGGQYL